MAGAQAAQGNAVGNAGNSGAGNAGKIDKLNDIFGFVLVVVCLFWSSNL